MKIVSAQSLIVLCLVTGCAQYRSQDPYVPATKYSPVSPSGDVAHVAPAINKRVALVPPQREIHENPLPVTPVNGQFEEPKAQFAMNSVKPSVTFVDGDLRPEMRLDNYPVQRGSSQLRPELLRDQSPELGKNAAAFGNEGALRVQRTYQDVPPPYASGLPLGDPGISASLWQESRGGNDIFRDFRAWLPMDLVTIVVSERSRGTHDADTLTNSRSTIKAVIDNLLGFEKQIQANWKNKPDLSEAITAQTQNEFRGEGETRRQAELTARISAVVVEVLPSGLMRVEGEKIISVNNEEQVMVISGLVRSRDINSNNEVNSSNIAQMRIDYYGKGIVGEAQYGGWLGRIMRLLWPF